MATRKTEIESKFSKNQLITSNHFRDRKDIVNAILFDYPETETFTISQVEEMIEKYMKG